MGCGGGGSRGGGRSVPPQNANPAPPPAATLSSGINGSFLGYIVAGLGFVGGYAIGHRVVDGIFGPGTINVHETTVDPHSVAATSMGGSDAGSLKAKLLQACTVQFKAFKDCLIGYDDDISKCQLYMDMLKECARNSEAGMK